MVKNKYMGQNHVETLILRLFWLFSKKIKNKKEPYRLFIL